MYKKSELMVMRRATASVESAATSGISVQRAIITRFKRVSKFDARRKMLLIPVHIL